MLILDHLLQLGYLSKCRSQRGVFLFQLLFQELDGVDGVAALAQLLFELIIPLLELLALQHKNPLIALELRILTAQVLVGLGQIFNFLFQDLDLSGEFFLQSVDFFLF